MILIYSNPFGYVMPRLGKSKASSGIRTRDLYLTKVTLYQAELSKHDFMTIKILITLILLNKFPKTKVLILFKVYKICWRSSQAWPKRTLVLGHAGLKIIYG